MIEVNTRPAHKKPSATLMLAAGMLTMGLLASAGAGQKRLTLTTSSPQAKDLLHQAVQALESFDNQKATQLAKSAVQADSNFAIAHMLVAALTLAPQRQPLVDKFKALAKNASPGEQLNTGKIDQAIPYFEKAIKLEGSLPRAYSFLGNCYLLKDNYAKARELEAGRQGLCAAKLSGNLENEFQQHGTCPGLS